ncbi:MAG: S1 RNA-binding domain-containing protein [Anaerofustis sp.]
MIQLGKTQTLTVTRQSPNGVYLNEKEDASGQEVLLPNAQVPTDAKVGDEVEVFVYNDSKDRMIATRKTPSLQIGEPAVLRVVQTTNIGAFLDWGLDKDLLLPFKQQSGILNEGDEVLVGLYVDKSHRLCATMKLYDMLGSESPYQKGDRVSGTVYRINRELGCFVAVDGKYHGMIPMKELYGNFRIGDTISARVKKVYEDGKLELSVREAAHEEIEGDAQIILDRMKQSGGRLGLNDDSSPEAIKSALNMSKKAFKRAVGRLLKEGVLKITDDGIELLWK